jgi:uncharacterized protein YabN with tetrapyrrole methylase and pyrophosphatase domain
MRDRCSARLKEEIAELETKLRKPAERRALEDEMGEILFAAANLARKLDIDPEAALPRAPPSSNAAFGASRHSPTEHAVGSDLDALEALWRQVKREEC